MRGLKNLEKQQQELAERIRKAKAREAQKKREEEKRRKLVVGEVVWNLAGEDLEVEEWLYAKLGEALTRPADRKLFDLPVLEEDKKEAKASDKVVAIEPAKTEESAKPAKAAGETKDNKVEEVKEPLPSAELEEDDWDEEEEYEDSEDEYDDDEEEE